METKTDIQASSDLVLDALDTTALRETRLLRFLDIQLFLDRIIEILEAEVCHTLIYHQAKNLIFKRIFSFIRARRMKQVKDIMDLTKVLLEKDDVEKELIQYYECFLSKILPYLMHVAIECGYKPDL